ncbi:protein aubergine-like [Scaptodrosophila lebanonensis]|uniref:Protein aubergine-like n=1 Tax=Drosophila lebanonensis TaxID=7225 RepID=A0A6J2T2B9_DROLE|nr:protein aubergine-like [Scaptodrosophila lebanonensis]
MENIPINLGLSRGRGRGIRKLLEGNSALSSQLGLCSQSAESVRGTISDRQEINLSENVRGRGRGRGIRKLLEGYSAPSSQLGLGSPSEESVRETISDRKETSWTENSQGSCCSKNAPARAPEPERSEVVAGDHGFVRGHRVITEIGGGFGNKSGTSGSKITVQANYFKVMKRPEWTIFKYHVDFIPDIDNTRLRRAYLNEHRTKLGGYIYDGSILFCTREFRCDPNNVYALEFVTTNRALEHIQIKIKKVGAVEKADAQQFQILNLILRRAMEGLKLELITRNFFDPLTKFKLDNYNVEIWPGFQTSIRQHETDILLCTEIVHKVMRTESLYDIYSNLSCTCEDHKQLFRDEVCGMVVLTDYNNKTYRVDDVEYGATPLSTFSSKEGDISYVQYYKKRYNITIRHYEQPLLVSRPTDKNIRGGLDQPIMLIPELARATGMNDAMRSNFRLMKAMSEHTRLPPGRRIERLLQFNNRLEASPQSLEVLTSWDLSLDKKLVEIPARVLHPEIILLGNNKQYTCDNRADWTGEFRNNMMYRHVDITRWAVVTPRRNIGETKEFVNYCIRAGSGMKMSIREPFYEEAWADCNESYTQALDRATSADPQIVMVVLKTSNEQRYASIKRRTCVDRPVPSQVVTLKVIAPRQEKRGGLMSIATKVVIQMNAKLMGTPWMIDLPLNGLMTAGFDVCHSTRKNKSYGALVTTMDMKTSGRYFSAVTEHVKGQELSDQMALNMTLALKAYREHHGLLPERILFYRDGVGDGQIHQVANIEVKLLKTKLDEIYRSAGKPEGCRLAFMIVSKRINTRYFVNNLNPPPGTIVDDIITLPERYDFFLVSQSVRQGTVSPTHYSIIHDNMGLSPDKLQMLSYKMTHLYYNFSGACRVPSVCQYAHKLAFLVAESINLAPSPGLENQLYFL